MSSVEIKRNRGRFNEYLIHEIKDPIWNSIPITDLEKNIIGENAFNRLGEINQMGVAWKTFPNARHSRLNHSLGVMYVADYLLRNILYIQKDKNGKEIEGVPLILCKFITYPIWQIFRIAALCHDIGHPPLSHVVEEGFRKNPQVIPDNEEARKNKFIKSISGKNNYSHEEATKYKLGLGADLYSLVEDEIGKRPLSQLPNLAIGEATEYPYTLLNPIINSDLDADKLDYLKRDGFHCGFYTTYDLNDFKDAIFIIESENPADLKPTLLITKEKIGAVNAFLYTRYREICEVHYDPDVRKATQIVIDLLIEKLEQIEKDKEKITYIEDLHLKNQDSDFWNSFKDNEKLAGITDKLRRSNSLDYNEVYPTFNKGIQNLLDFEDLNPEERVRCHSILSNPPSISKIQKALREEFDDESLLVDFRTAKPPKFSVYVKVRDGFNLPLFHISETAKGILRDSISYLNIHFYTRKKPEPVIYSKKVKEEIRKYSDEAMDKYFKKNGCLFSHLLILIGLGTILEHSKNEMGFSDPWLIGQLELQKMLEFISKPDRNPYGKLESRKAHPRFVKDIETLIVMGMIIERKMCINYPANKKDLSREELLDVEKVNHINIPRNNYQFSAYGYKYFEILTNYEENSDVQKEINRIIEKIIKIQECCKNALIGFNKNSLKIEKLRDKVTLDLLKIQDEREEQREFVRENYGCMISTKYD